MYRVILRSRRGNLVIAALGALYALGSLAVLIAFVVDAWRAVALLDLAIQVALLACAVCGVWFVVTALENLGVHRRSLRH